MFRKLSEKFYLNDDVIALGKALLGKYLYTNIDTQLTGGKIVETESYKGIEDKACHAFGGRKTPRTKVMYLPGGAAYIYLCYGMHHLFNVVTNKKGIPHAILIRAIEPTDGIEYMLQRRKKVKLDYTLTSGPGSLSKALALTKHLSGNSLLQDQVWIEDRNILIEENNIISSPRVGIDYAEDHALLPWRFRVKNNPWTSRPK